MDAYEDQEPISTSSHSVGPPAEPPSPTPPKPHRSALIWVGLGALTYAIYVTQLVGFAPPRLADPADASSFQLELTGRYLLGIEQFEDAFGLGAVLDDEATTTIQNLTPWDSPIHDQIRAAALIGEFDSPEAALDRLDFVEQRLELMRAESEFDERELQEAPATTGDDAPATDANTDVGDEDNADQEEDDDAATAANTDVGDEDNADQEEDDDAPNQFEEYANDIQGFREIFAHLAAREVDDSSEPWSSPTDFALDADARERLLERHGWFTELAISPLDGESDLREQIEAGGSRVLLVLLGGLGAILTAGLVGLVLLILFVVQIAGGRVRARYDAGAQTTAHRPHAYLEMVALFLASIIALQLFLGLVVALVGLLTGDESLPVFEGLSLLVWVLALVTLWPLARGVSFAQLRRDLGWHRGEGVLKEIGAGLVAYLAGLPIIALGLGLVVLISALTAAQPTHPIGGGLEAGGFWTIVILYLLAAVWAPLVEETIFRGALYHHLRSRVGAGVLASAMTSGFIFAVIHPQGFAGVPALLALAVVLALLREWRGSLIGPIFVHALHNASILTLLLLIMP